MASICPKTIWPLLPHWLWLSCGKIMARTKQIANWSGPANSDRVLRCVQSERMDTRMTKRRNFSDHFTVLTVMASKLASRCTSSLYRAYLAAGGTISDVIAPDASWRCTMRVVFSSAAIATAYSTSARTNVFGISFYGSVQSISSPWVERRP